MKRMLRNTIFVAMICMLCTCCKHDRMSELESLNKEANEAMSTFMSERIDSIGQILLDRAKSYGDRVYEGKAHFYLSYMRPNLPDSIKKLKLKHLDAAEKIAIETANDTLLCYVYNQKGVWELSDMNTLTAQYWFSRSIEKGKNFGDRKFTIPAEMNMSEAMRISGDTMGIRYDRELFSYACSHDLRQPKFSAAIHCAVHYADVAQDSVELYPYIEAIREMSDVYPDMDQMVYARFFLKKGQYDKAEQYISQSNPDRFTDFQMLYGEILNKAGKYNASEEWLGKAYENIDNLFPIDRMKLLRLRASNKHGLGDDKDAYLRQMEYEAYRDSLERTRSFDLVKRYRAEYEATSKDREISKQKMYIRQMRLVALVVAIIVAGCIAFYAWWQYRRNRFYKDIVRQNRDFMERQKLLVERIGRRDAQIAELRNERSEKEEPSERGSRISDERSNEIFERIQHLTEEKQVWRDPSITRDLFTDMVGCNRTYLTEVLKTKTCMNYTQYMNSCRVREAVRVLSDPDDETPLKTLSEQLGFLTIQTFYTSFKKDIGMSPAAFRKSARELEETDHKHKDLD